MIHHSLIYGLTWYVRHQLASPTRPSKILQHGSARSWIFSNAQLAEQGMRISGAKPTPWMDLYSPAILMPLSLFPESTVLEMLGRRSEAI